MQKLTWLIGTKDNISTYKNKNKLDRNASFTNIRALKKVSKLYKNGEKDYSTHLFRGCTISSENTIILINLSDDEEQYIRHLICILHGGRDDNLPTFVHTSTEE